jgi:hypothetical protein
MIRKISSIALFSAFLVTTFAGPKIEFDTKAFNCGTAVEGVTEKIQATFIVKNVGDSILKLTNVKPGCGCTVVKFDSIIPPGKTTKIEAEVNIKGYHSGPITKYVNVFSNAESEATRLSIEATIQATIDASETYIRFDPTSMSAKTITLTTKKIDLKITGATFNSDNANNDASKKIVKLQVPFKFVTTDSIRTGGYKVYKLEITPPKFEESHYGQFIFSTNHPDRKELTIRGNLSK